MVDTVPTVTSRTNASRTGLSRPRRRVAADPGPALPRAAAPPSRWPVLLRIAVLLALLAAVLGALGPLLPITVPAQAPGFRATALHVALAGAPLLLVLVLRARGQAVAAARVLVIGAMFAPGQLLSELQSGTDPSRGSRPDLTLPDSLTPVVPGPGLWLLLTGQLVAIGAGVAALRAARGGEPLPDGRDARQRAGGVAVALSFGALAGIALLLSEPFETGSLFQLVRSPLEQPWPGFLGGLLLVLAAPLAAGVAMGSGSVVTRRSGAAAVALALAAASLPQLLSGAVLPGFTTTWGPPVVLACAVAVLAVGFVPGRAVAGADESPADLALPGAYRLNLATGVLGVLTGASGALAGLLGAVHLPPGLRVPSYADRLLLPAGLLVALIAAVLLFGVLAPPVARPGEAARTSRIPDAVRPALLVLLAAMPFAATMALDGALAVTEVPGAEVGAGAALAGVAVLGALGTAVAGGLAGAEERADVDLTERSVRPAMVAVAVPAAVLALGAFGLPVLLGGAYSSPALLGEFSLGWWGLAVAVCAVLVAVLLATSARPARAGALLTGAALLVGVRALELPLTVERVRGGAPATGWWCALAGVVVLLLGAVLAVLLKPGTAAHTDTEAASGTGGRLGPA